MNSTTAWRAGCLTPVLCALAGLAQGAADDLRLVDAAARQDSVVVRALLQEGVDVNAPQADGATALLWAAHWNDPDTVDLLLRAGADVNAAEDHGVTPLARACENRAAAMVEKLVAAGADVNAGQTNGVTPLMLAARTGSVRVMRELIAHGADVNAATSDTGHTVLMWAIAQRHLDAARVLVEAGADVAASSRVGFTPLLFAARNGDLEAGRLLLAAGAAVDAHGSDGSHALPLAVLSGRDAFVEFLLEQGADPNGSLYGVSALHVAAGPVDMWLREWLRVRGVDVHRTVASIEPGRRLAMVEALLGHGADPNARISTPATVQYYVATKRGAFETFAIGTGNLRGATPLWVAAFAANGRRSRQTGWADVIRVLLAAGADPSLTTDDQTTPLMVAAGIGHASFQPGKPRGNRSPSAEETVRVLIKEAGVDVNAVNEAGFTALHGAAFRGLNEVVQYLVEQGAAIDAQDFRGRTPFRIAEGAKQSFQFQAWPETAELLRNLGADTALGVPWDVLEREQARATGEAAERREP